MKQQNSCNTVFPRDIIFLRNISINTLHKGDDDDHHYDNDNNHALIALEASSLIKCVNENSRNFGKYFKAAPQITLHILHCNLMVVLTKPKHVATLLKQSNFSNYSVVMSDCLSLFIFPRLTIYRAVHLTNCYL